MNLSSDFSLLEVSCRILAPNDVVDWHAHRHDELCLVLEGTPTVGHAGSKLIREAGTLFLFKESEEHGFWNPGSASVRLWLLEFRVSSRIKVHFGELFDRSPEGRVLKLSAGQRRQYCCRCQRLAFERGRQAILAPLRRPLGSCFSWWTFHAHCWRILKSTSLIANKKSILNASSCGRRFIGRSCNHPLAGQCFSA